MESRLKYLFGEEPLTYPNETYLNYVTPTSVAKEVFRVAHDFMNLESKVVWDMFAGIGTDSLELAKVSGKVVSTEINPDTFKCLKKNTSGVESIECYQRDAVNNWVASDAVFFDPPWGRNYNKHKPFDFLGQRVGSFSIRELIKLLHRKHDIIIKAPINCDMEGIFEDAEIEHVMKFTQQRVQFYLVRSLKD
jgi:predicted RNA methylase